MVGAVSYRSAGGGVWQGRAHSLISRAERWYYAGAQGLAAITTLPSVSFSLDVLYAIPIYQLRGKVKLDRLAMAVTTATATAKCRVGLYRSLSPTQLYPGALLADSGEFDCGSTGVKSASFTSLFLPDDVMVWAAIIFGTTKVSAIRAHQTPSSFACAPASGLTNFAAADQYTDWSVAQAYGTLPSSYPGSATPNSNGIIPLVAMRVAGS